MTNAIRLCCTYILSENVPMNTNRREADLFPIIKPNFVRLPEPVLFGRKTPSVKGRGS